MAAYCYMSLVPVIQPPIIKLLTSKAERKIRMPFMGETPVSDTALFVFPLIIILIAGAIAPISVPLIGSLMFGNLLKVSGVTEDLSNCAQNELSNLVTLFLGITVGGTMTAENFLTMDVFKILCLGAVAFVFDTAGGVILQNHEPVPDKESKSDDRGLRYFCIPHVRTCHRQDGIEG